MSGIKRFLLVLPAVLMLIPLYSQGQTVVRETSDGDLMVIEFRGKPPHKRQFISVDDTERYARFAPMVDSVLVATESSRRAGPPGKMFSSGQAVSVERIPASEISQFAQFEETDEPSSNNTSRRSGPPGKGGLVSPR